jgi:hypothetical protein
MPGMASAGRHDRVADRDDVVAGHLVVGGERLRPGRHARAQLGRLGLGRFGLGRRADLLAGGDLVLHAGQRGRCRLEDAAPGRPGGGQDHRGAQRAPPAPSRVFSNHFLVPPVHSSFFATRRWRQTPCQQCGGKVRLSILCRIFSG